jgi:hypothetical protein
VISVKFDYALPRNLRPCEPPFERMLPGSAIHRETGSSTCAHVRGSGVKALFLLFAFPEPTDATSMDPFTPALLVISTTPRSFLNPAFLRQQMNAREPHHLSMSHYIHQKNDSVWIADHTCHSPYFCGPAAQFVDRLSIEVGIAFIY